FGDGFGDAGTYVTWHAPRTADWPARIAEGHALEQKFRKPVVSDEPIGAGEAVVPGRRDNDPARFRQAAVESRRAAIGATFHYDGGVQARLPGPAEMACLDAWM